MAVRNLILVLGDQLSWQNPALLAADPAQDHLLLAEVMAEASYVRHSRHKIVLLFAAMRHFAQELRHRGFTVHYREIGEGVEILMDEELLFRGEIGEVSGQAAINLTSRIRKI